MNGSRDKLVEEVEGLTRQCISPIKEDIVMTKHSIFLLPMRQSGYFLLLSHDVKNILFYKHQCYIEFLATQKNRI